MRKRRPTLVLMVTVGVIAAAIVIGALWRLDRRDRKARPAPPGKRLYFAALAGDPDAVRTLVAGAPELANTPVKVGARKTTALHAAVLGGNAEVVRILLTCSDVNAAESAEGLTPLHQAVIAPPARGPRWPPGAPGNVSEDEIVRRALSGEVEAEGGDRPAEAEHEAADEIVRALLAAGADVNGRNKQGQAPLHHAAGLNRLAHAELLASHGAEIDATDAQGCTPLHHAVAAGSKAVAEFLVAQGANIAAAEAKGRTIAGYAAGTTAGRLAFCLWEAKLLAGPRPLTAKQARRLIRADAGVVALTGPQGQTLLHAAAGRASPDLTAVLIECGARINARTSGGQTPLHEAVLFYSNDEAETGQEEVVRLLCDKGADVNAADGNGRTPLAYAARRAKDRIAGMLLARKADPTRPDKYGATPLTHAAIYGRVGILKAMLGTGAEPDAHAAASLGMTERLGRLIEQDKRLVNAHVGKERKTLLHTAVRMARTGIVGQLLTAGADPNGRDANGCTPLHLTTGTDPDLVAALLKGGADVNARDSMKRTPLHYAVRLPRAVIVILIKAGADVNARDAKGRTPLGLVPRGHYGSVKELLRDYGAEE